MADGCEHLGRVCAATQVSCDDTVGRHSCQHVLLALRRDDAAQHVMTLDDTLPGPFQTGQIDRGAFKLPIRVAAHIAQFERSTAADPIGLLDVSEWKGGKAVGWRCDARHDPACTGLEKLEQGRLMACEMRPVAVSEHTFLGADGQLTAIGRQFDTALPQILE
jgi:hypothetical protein